MTFRLVPECLVSSLLQQRPRLANKITEIEITNINKQSFSVTLIMEFSYIWNALKVQRKESNTGDWTGSYIAFFFLLLFLSIQGTLYVSWRDRTPNLPTSRRPALPRKQQPPQYWQQKCLNMLQLKNIQRPQSSFQDLVEHLKWDSAVWGLLWHVQSWDAEKGRIWTGTHPKALKGRGKSFKNSMSVCTLTIIIWVSIWYY